MNYLPLVNTRMGSRSVPRFSCGNTLPLTQLPFGMASFCPQTDGGSAWFYHPDHPYAEGIRLTHQPSPWIRDYGTVLLTPQSDLISPSAGNAWSGLRLSESTLQPHYLSLHLLRPECLFELTPTARGAAIRLSFEHDRPRYLSLLPTLGSYTYRFDAATQTLFATADGHSMDDAKQFCMYLVLRFPAGAVDPTKIREDGEGASAAIHLPLTARVTEARLAISYISHDMALTALERECGADSFETLQKRAEAEWEEKLHRIEIETDIEEEARTFYSCLWRTFLFPHAAYELDRSENEIHYAPSLGEVRPGPRYTDTGLWDTARTQFPLFSLIAKKEFAHILEGFVNDYRDSGWLPRWPSLGEVGCMPSTFIDCVVAEAAVHGIGSPALWETALEGMLKHANTPADDERYGRNGVSDYLRYGYVPADHKDAVNLTVDAAYGDWCIATVADILGKQELAAEYRRRAGNYRHLFDPASGLMRGKCRDGSFLPDFDPVSWGGVYTEGSAWQNSFFVPHDLPGLTALHGGREALFAKLDELFAEKPRYRTGAYSSEIHEMTEMANADLGQCAISNQPSFHVPFLYAALGEPERTNAIVAEICRNYFHPTPDGYPGDEDNGSMSAWYIFAMLGFYPLCPGDPTLTHFRPQVKKSQLKIENCQ